MPKYKSPDGVSGINIGGEYFAADKSGCITVPDGNYYGLLVPLGYEFQQETAATPTTTGKAAAATTAP